MRNTPPFRSSAGQTVSTIRNILVIGDIHVGSMYGILPPDFVSSDGAQKPQNEGQKYLWECWQDMKHKAAKFAIDSIVVNNEMVRRRVA